MFSLQVQIKEWTQSTVLVFTNGNLQPIMSWHYSALTSPGFTFLRSWAEPCPAGKCCSWYSILCASVELSDGVWIWPKICLSWGSIHHDRRIQYSSSRRHGEHESGKSFLKQCMMLMQHSFKVLNGFLTSKKLCCLIHEDDYLQL